MPTVWVVDDEEMIRKGIVSIINRLAPQWQVSECIDAKSTLHNLQHDQPDLMLIDVNMPGIDGLELANLLKENYPHIVKIILTGHDKFSYVQSALRADALDYLLKPVIREELMEALLKAERVLEQRQLKDKQDALTKQLQLEKCLEELFSGVKVAEDEIQQLLLGNGWRLTGKEFAVLILIGEREGYHLNKNNLPFSMQAFNAEFQDICDCFSFFVDPKHFILLCSGTNLSTEKMKQWWLNRWLSDEEDSLSKTNVNIVAGVSPSFHSLSDLPELYWKTIYETFKVEKDQEKLYLIYRDKAWNEQQKKIVIALGMNDVASFQLFLQDWFKELKQHAIMQPSMMLYQLFHFFLMTLIPLLNQVDSKLSRFLRHEIAFVLTKLSSPGSSVTFFSIMDEFETNLQQFTKTQSENLEQNKVIDIVKEHISKNYGNKDLKLDSLSKIVHMNPNYLSDLFKEVTGENYIAYLTLVRMNNAKKLLRETHLKTYEISDQVGYTTAKYFCKLFRQLYGLTPTEYRNRAE